MNRKYLWIIFLMLFVLIAALSAVAQTKRRTPESDRQALIKLENEWLANEHDATSLEKILADDFVHPVPTGDVLTRSQHIYYSTKHPSPAGQKSHFENLTVRIYGDAGIANGLVVTTDNDGKEIKRTIFTDVFAFRNGSWQAVNAQENLVEKRPPPK